MLNITETTVEINQESPNDIFANKCISRLSTNASSVTLEIYLDDKDHHLSINVTNKKEVTAADIFTMSFIKSTKIALLSILSTSGIEKKFTGK